MAQVEIQVSGCDDSSTVVLELDAGQFKAIKLLADEINKLDTYTCTPSIEVRKLPSEPNE